MSVFLKNTLKLSSAPVITQILSFFALPIITRIYDPDHFGTFNLIASVAGVFSVFCGLGYHQAIVLPKKDNDALDLLKISFLITFLLSIVVFIFLSFIPLKYYENYEMQDIYAYIWTIPLLIFFHGLYVTLLGWNIRKTNYGVIAFSRVMNVLSNKSYIILIGIISVASATALILGTLIGSIIMSLLLFFWSFSEIKVIFKNNLSNIKILLLRYKQFPIYNVGNDLVYRAKQALIIIVLTYFFSSSIAGHYGMALLILAIPTTLIGSSISEVFYQKISNNSSTNQIKSISLRLFKFLCFGLFFSYAFLSFYSHKILPFFLGEKWLDTGMIISILSLFCFIEFIFTPCHSILKVKNKQQYLFIYQLSIIIFSLLSLVIGGIFNSYLISFILFSLSNSIISIFLGVYTFKLIKIEPINIFKVLLKTILYSIPPTFIVFIIDNFFELNIFNIILLGFISIFMNLSIILKFEIEFFNDFKLLLPKSKFF